jgi:hypothetical protein
MRLVLAVTLIAGGLVLAFVSPSPRRRCAAASWGPPSVTVDEPDRLSAVVSGPVIMHT